MDEISPRKMEKRGMRKSHGCGDVPGRAENGRRGCQGGEREHTQGSQGEAVGGKAVCPSEPRSMEYIFGTSREKRQQSRRTEYAKVRDEQSVSKGVNSSNFQLPLRHLMVT